MPKLTNVFESSVSPSEMRLKMAVEIARLKIEVDRYQQLVKSATESGDYAAANKLVEMRSNATLEIIRLKKEVDKYQQFGKCSVEPGNNVARKNVTATHSSIQSVDRNERQQKNTLKKTTQEPGKTKESEWVDKQALRLFGQLAMNKG